MLKWFVKLEKIMQEMVRENRDEKLTFIQACEKGLVEEARKLNLSQPVGWVTLMTAYNMACATGNLELLELVFEIIGGFIPLFPLGLQAVNYSIFPVLGQERVIISKLGQGLRLACKNGHKAVFDRVFRSPGVKEALFKDERLFLLQAASEEGQLGLIKYFLPDYNEYQREEGISGDALEECAIKALASGHREVFDFFWSIYPKKNWTHRALISTVCLHGDSALLKTVLAEERIQKYYIIRGYLVGSHAIEPIDFSKCKAGILNVLFKDAEYMQVIKKHYLLLSSIIARFAQVGAYAEMKALDTEYQEAIDELLDWCIPHLATVNLFESDGVSKKVYVALHLFYCDSIRKRREESNAEIKAWVAEVNAETRSEGDFLYMMPSMIDMDRIRNAVWFLSPTEVRNILLQRKNSVFRFLVRECQFAKDSWCFTRFLESKDGFFEYIKRIKKRFLEVYLGNRKANKQGKLPVLPEVAMSIVIDFICYWESKGTDYYSKYAVSFVRSEKLTVDSIKRIVKYDEMVASIEKEKALKALEA